MKQAWAYLLILAVTSLIMWLLAAAVFAMNVWATVAIMLGQLGLALVVAHVTARRESDADAGKSK